jgi:hypothetical protein
MVFTIHSLTLQRAAALLGGAPALSEYLDVPLRRLQLWMRGTLPPPNDIFLKAVDVVAERDLRILRGELQEQLD